MVRVQALVLHRTVVFDTICSLEKMFLLANEYIILNA